MKGSVQYRKDRQCWFVAWWDAATKKSIKIYRYKGELMYSDKIAEKLLAMMQSDFENGVFRIEKYQKTGWTDTVEYLWEWLESVAKTLTPAGYKDYSNSIRNHLEPFFREFPYQLHEIQYDVLLKLLNHIQRAGKGKYNVMYCLHKCLKDARRSGRIPVMPEFPEKKRYKIQEPVIRWLPTERQTKIIEAIPEDHQPIFWFLKYHMRRPAEAMALYGVDYDPEQDVFIIRRSISSRKYVDATKTKQEHVIPCHPDFKPIMAKMPPSFSHYFFTCQSSRTEGQRYTHKILDKLWKDACREVGEQITMYQGLKHSSCSQYINEAGLHVSDLQELTDHARYESVKRYAKTEVSRKRQLYEVGRNREPAIKKAICRPEPNPRQDRAKVIPFPKHSRKLE